MLQPDVIFDLEEIATGFFIDSLQTSLLRKRTMPFALKQRS